MFVLTDIEWVSNADDIVSLTQIAAVKVDENWNEVNRFASFIRPKNSAFHDWEHMAYTGGTASEFLHAENAHTVLTSFLQWLNEDDIILWWHTQSDAVFKKLVSLIFKTKIQNKTICINAYVYAFLYGQENSKGNIYNIAKARGVETNSERQHCSANDANVMRMLMQKIAYPQSELCKPLVRPEKGERPFDRFKKLPYQYDPNTNTIHLKDCPELLNGEIVTQGYETWKIPLRKSFKPCACCKDAYQKAFRERNRDILERSQYTYVYTADSKVFHKCSCGAMHFAKSILGARKYETVINTGRKPCKRCNPTPEDAYKALSPQRKIVRIRKGSSQTVSKEDSKAIARQKVAVEERNRRLKDASLTKQERDDIYTLTQPRFAFWAGQGYQTFHLRTCYKLQEVSNLRGFATYDEAVLAGFTPCRKCKPTAKHDMKLSVPINNRVRTDEKIEDLESMCTDAGYVFQRESAYLYLETPVGKWRMHLSDSPVKLDHINLVKTPGVQIYHKQPRLFLSFADAFDYIKRHDDELERRAAEGKVFVKFFAES